MTKGQLFACVIALAACGSPPVEPIDDYNVSTTSINFTHQVGDTDCPQDLGDVTVNNLSANFTLFATISVADVGGIDLIDFGDADDLSPTSVDSIEIEVAPQSSEVFVPWFNCDQPTSFDTTITIAPEDLELGETDIAVSAAISSAIR